MAHQGRDATDEVRRLLAQVAIDDWCPVALTDDQFKVLWVNDAFTTFGWEAEQLLGGMVLDWVHPADQRRAGAILGALGGRAELSSAAYRLKQGDQTWVSLEVSGSRVDRGDGQSSHYVFTLRPHPFEQARKAALTAMVTGAAPEVSLAPLTAEFSASRPASAICFDVAERRAILGDLDPALVGVFDGVQDRTPGMPWAEALAGDEVVLVRSLDGLPEPTRKAAERAGVHSAAFLRTLDPGRTTPALIGSWIGAQGTLEVLAVNMEETHDLVTLALERRAVQEVLEHLAEHDPLTGLSNRVRFFAVLEGWASPDRTSTAIAVAYVDLDDFKTANDRLGHGAGDAILVEVGRRFATCLTGDGLVARLGGDEFGALITYDPIDPDTPVRVAQSLLAAVHDPIVVEGEEATIGASVGLARIGDSSGADHDSLVRAADAALYRAKARGKNSIEVIDL